jgi:hypothetical protein
MRASLRRKKSSVFPVSAARILYAGLIQPPCLALL